MVVIVAKIVPPFLHSLLGGSWVVISPLSRVISIVTLLITPLITTHEPPSTNQRQEIPKHRASWRDQSLQGLGLSVIRGQM